MRRSVSLFAVAVMLAASTGWAQDGASTTSSSERKITSRAEPVYPELAKKMHIRGVVRVEAIIRPNGTVKSTRVLGGNPVLVDAAADAISKWKFEPAQAETTQIVQLTFAVQ